MTSPLSLRARRYLRWCAVNGPRILIFAVGIPCCITLMILASASPETAAAAAPFSGTPYTGSAITVPGRIEAENFDNGGESVAYHDTTTANEGGFYRSGGVDICTCGSPYGLSVGWTQPGEWMEYTVTVPSYGNYKFQTLTATTVSGSALHIEVDGVNVTGQMILPNTGAWSSYATTSSTGVTVTAGQHVVRVAVDVTGFLIDSVDVVRLNTPYGGTAIALPGVIQAENFDNGGEGFAYHDTTSANEGGAYRAEGVDLCFCGYSEGAALGWSSAGEWTRYTVNFNTTDTYALQAKMSTIVNGCVIHLELDGINVTGPMPLPNTGSWDTWTTVSKPNVQIPAGPHELKMVIDAGGFLLDSLSVLPSLPSAPSGLAATAVSNSQINLVWTDNSFNESGFKIERKIGTSGTYAQIVTPATGATTFGDTGLQPGTQYFYRIRATNLAGNSAYSNESSATPLNLPPSVSVTSPGAGTVFTAPANIAIVAAASDSDGSVSKVEFFQGSTKLGEDLTAPYSVTWTNVAAGTYNLTAKATDNLGGSTTSASVAITVNAPPTVSVTAPAANTVFHAPANVTITASASDSDGTIAKVEFFQNGALLGEDTTFPFSYVWNNAPVGTISLTARATDSRNATTTSSAVTIRVNNPPSVSINAPTANSTFIAGSTIAIAATSIDTDGSVSKVEFYQGATKLGEDTALPFTFDWSNVGPGSYSLTAVATDDQGAATTSSAVPVNVVSNAIPRLDPMNRTGGSGEDPLSRNFNWSLPLVNLPGRAGMDLSLSLSYNSLVWTKIASNSISFDDDHGFPSAGFRLGFPTIQPLYYNAEVGKYAFLLIGSDGSRTELRQVNASALYESADSSHMLFDTNTLVLSLTDGAQLTYQLLGGEYKCAQIKDRNGNYITISHSQAGRLDTITDTLGRVLTFNYDGAGLLISITQQWNQSTSNDTHYWARFEYANKTVHINFPGFTVLGTADGADIKTLTRVKLSDNSYFDFTYTSWGQVYKISSYAPDTHLLNYRSYNLPDGAGIGHSDCPRFTERRDWAQYWNGNTGLAPVPSEEALTMFEVPVSDTWTMPNNTQKSGMRAQVTAPDGTSNKIYFISSSGWQRGLPALVDTYPSGSSSPVRRSMTTWTQDNTTVSYPLNPRVTETNIYDDAGNRARTETTYEQFTFTNGTSCYLPRDFYEYANDENPPNPPTMIRSRRTTYNMTSTYTDRHIFGLVSVQLLYEGNVNTTGVLKSKTGFFYDESGSVQNTSSAPEHHDSTYGTNLVAGRGNLTSVKRYDVTSTAEITTVRSKYNIAGSLTSSKDALDHETTVGYTDVFSDNVTRTTFAYPTIITDPDGHSSTSKYHFDFGAVTRRQTPQPNNPNPQLGPEQSWSYDSNGRLLQVTNVANSSYTRFEYPTSNNRVDTYVTIKDDFVEAHSFSIADGAGRVIATATDHPGSDGGFSGQKFVYDKMGRTIKTSNPTETDANGAPSQWATPGADASWIYTEQTYDWKGRPLVTTNPSMTSNPSETTTKVIAYSGCGCAGGQVATITDEGVLDTAGALKKRQQKIYSDVLGRIVKTEILNWDGTGPNGTGGSVYAATTMTYNVRDQVTTERRFAGPATSSTYQDTTMSYDGFGRLKTQHLPQQQVDVNNSASSDHTTWNYNNDDTVESLTDARGVITTFTYNARHLVTVTAFNSSNIPSGSHVVPTSNITYGYDGAGNRLSMSDGSGSAGYHYDQLSRMDWEERTFAGLPNAGVFRLSYEYSLGGVLTKVTDQRSGTSFTDTLDKVGRVTAVNAITVGGVPSQFVSQTKYRAWGDLKSRTQAGITVNFTYNSRLLPATYEMDGSLPVQMAYEYHNDGSIKYADEQTGFYQDVIDRAYAYDNAGRVQYAYSGVEARNFVNNTTGGTPDGPYKHQYSYDQWDNLLQDTGRIWSRPVNTSDSYNANNRVPAWTYDASGNVISRNEIAPDFLPFLPAVYTFDAAGRQVGSTQTRTYTTQYYGDETSVFVNSQTFDGGNQMTHYALVRNVPPNNPQIPPSTQTTAEAYLLRSTVLGGSVISEYKADGTWSKTHVYAGAERLGEQTTAPSGALQSRIENLDPITGDGMKYLSDGGFFNMTTLDPNGVDVGASEPTPLDENGGLGELTKNVPYINPIEGGGAKCILDGLEIECSRINGNSSVQCPNNDCNATVRLVFRSRGEIVATSVQPAPEGWDPAYDGTYVFNDGLPWRRKGGDGPGRRRQVFSHVRATAPQNPNNKGTPMTDAEIAKHRAAAEELLQDKTCKGFVDGVLAQIGEGERKAFDGDILNIFDKVTSLKGWGWRNAADMNFDLGEGGSYVGNTSQTAFINISRAAQIYGDSSSTAFVGRIVIHELLHVGSGAGGNFSHWDMFKAAYSVATSLGLNLGVRKPTEKDPGGRDIYNANGFDDLLFQACQIRKVRGIQ